MFYGAASDFHFIRRDVLTEFNYFSVFAVNAEGDLFFKKSRSAFPKEDPLSVIIVNMDNFGDQLPACANVRKALILDIDNTCTTGADARDCPRSDRSVQPAWPGNFKSGSTEYVKELVSEGERKGYTIAFATSETSSEAMNSQQRKFIQHIYPKADDNFFRSSLFQTSGKILGDEAPEFSHKQPMLMNILGVHGLNLHPDEIKCSVFVDDDIQNLADAKKLGLRVVQASPECGGAHCTLGCGVTSRTRFAL